MYDFNHLTNKKLADVMKFKSNLLFLVRKYFYENNFIEIDTPILSFPTKEYGDGEFIVFSKLNPGKFYALPHSPQLYKQYIIATMGNKIEKYFQLASNFRPEVGDRIHVQEFKQIDFEISNPSLSAIMRIIEEIICLSFSVVNITPKFIELSYMEAINKYGSDSPDLRFSKAKCQFENNDIFFEINNTDIIKHNFSDILKVFPHIQLHKLDNKYRFLTTENKMQSLGALRNKLIENGILRLDQEWSFVWIKNLPLFVKENGSIKTSHHPYAQPMDTDCNYNALSEKELFLLRTQSCDLIINGFEVAGGNLRINNYNLQKQILEFIGCSKQDLQSTYLPLLTLLKEFPHHQSGGAAVGLERLIMLLTDSTSLYDIQAFPMTFSGIDFFKGPKSLTPDEFVSVGVQGIPEIISRSRNTAINLIKKNNNYIHDEDHIINVEKNVYKLTQDKNFLSNEVFSLILAAHWHDVGKNDTAIVEKIPHEELSVQEFKRWALDVGIDPFIIKLVCLIINQHRNRSSNGEIKNRLAGVLWDADKLDILNLHRCKKIISGYRYQRTFDNEFNYFDTLVFWKSIDDHFLKKFHTQEAKNVCNELYPVFKKFVDEQFKKNIIKSKKIIGIGGAEPISGKLKKLDKMILSSLTEKKICYIPIGIFNNDNLLGEMDDYARKVERYYKSLDGDIEFTCVKPNDNVQDIIDKINKSNIIYIAGGDTEFLIQQLKDERITFAIKQSYESGKYLIGNSAGILSLLDDTFSINENNEQQHYKGIGIIDDYIIIVHYDDSKKDICEKIKAQFPKKNLVLLKEDDAIMILNKEVSIFY